MAFFNDIGNFVNEKILNPIGTWAKDTWNGAVERMKKGETIFDQVNKEIINNEKVQNKLLDIYHKTEPGTPIGDITNKIAEKVNSGIININPLATAEEKQQAKEEFKYINNPQQEILNKIKENQETSGNSQSIGNTQDTPSIEEIWEREDAIRKETQEREDTAYQRAVEDMRKAGINPNLVGVSPAGSGGGITQATGQGMISTEMSGAIQEAIAQINNTVKADENQKDRISDIIKTLAMYFILKKK